MGKIWIMLWLSITTIYYIYAKRGMTNEKYMKDVLYILGLPMILKLTYEQRLKMLSLKETHKLKKIYALKDLEEGVTHYQSVRIGIVYITIVLGVLFTIVLGSDYKKSDAIGYSIERPEFGEQAMTYDLKYELNVDSKDKGYIPITVEPKLPSRDESIHLITKKIKDLEQIMYRGNSATEVYQDLVLPKKSFEEPIVISYVSLTPEYVSHQGKLKLSEMTINEPYECAIVATFSIGGLELPNTYKFIVTPRPLSAKEVSANIEAYVLRDEAQVILPEVIEDQGVSVKWSSKEEGIASYKLLLLTLLVAILLYVFKQYELDQAIESRREEILYDFPNMVNKITMLVNAGMTFSRAWHKIVSDYQNQNKGQRVLYEEMLVVSQDIMNGVSEIQAIEAFARRSQCKEVIRLVAIITQNLKRGSQSMTEALKLLSIEVWDIRISTAKKMGEKASTKLLIPMGISLITVLMIVIVPTFMTMKI
jgi:hypothetical protein